MDLLGSRSELSTLRTAVMAAGLDGTLSSGNFTLFAPTDAAFGSLPEGYITSLVHPTYASELTGLLTYHVVAGTVSSGDLQQGMVATVEGQDLNVTMGPPTLINGVDITTEELDIVCTNGVVHVVSNVLIPPIFDFPKSWKQMAVEAPELSTVVATLNRTGWLDSVFSTQTTWTALLPNDNAFAALPVGFLKTLEMAPYQALYYEMFQHHSLLGSVQFASDFLAAGAGTNYTTAPNPYGPVGVVQLVSLAGGLTFRSSGGVDANVIYEDLLFANGVTHIVDQVLMPAEHFVLPNLIESATRNSLSVLSTLITTANLASVFTGMDEYTIFAPTDAAFSAVSVAVRNALQLTLNRGKLQELLQFHVVTGRVSSAGIPATLTPLFASANPLVLTADPASVNGAAISTPDIYAENGYIHVIDSVLFPDQWTFPDKNAWQTISGIDTLSTFMAAVSAAGWMGIFENTGTTTFFAPDNDAFAALPAGVLDLLLLPQNQPVLDGILQYHTIAGSRLSSELGTEVQTSQGALNVSMLNVTAPDIACAQGVILHIIDSVLLPSSFSADNLTNTTTTTMTVTATESITDGAVRSQGAFSLIFPLVAAVPLVQHA